MTPLLRLYLTLHDPSTTALLALHDSALLESLTLYRGSTCLYFTLLDLTLGASLHLNLLHSTMPPVHLALLDSTLLYYTLPCLGPLGSTWLYLTLLHSTTAVLSSTGFYLNILHSIMARLGSTSIHLTRSTTLYHASSWLCFILSSTRIYLTILRSFMPLIGST